MIRLKVTIAIVNNKAIYMYIGGRINFKTWGPIHKKIF